MSDLVNYVDLFAKAAATAGGTVAGKQIVEDAYPEVKKLGKRGVEIVKALHRAGYGRDQIAVLYDDLTTFVGRAMLHVAPPNQVDPPLQILGPILEQLRYEPIDTPVAEMLEAILARSMDKERVFDAHPAFIQIVRGLVADEVRLLRYLAKEPLVAEWVPTGTDAGDFPIEHVPSGLLEAPDALMLYYVHLSSLGLCMLTYDYKAPVIGVDGSLITPQHDRPKIVLMKFGEHLMRAADLSSSPPPAGDDEDRAPSA